MGKKILEIGNTFSSKLHYLRNNNNYTLDELADLLTTKYNYKIDKSLLSKYERGVHEPNFYLIDLIASIFGVTTDWLIGRSENMYGEELPKYKEIPILSSYNIDSPILIQNDIIDYVSIPYSENVHFCLKIKDNSMIGVRIFDGDIAYICKQDDIENGELAVVYIDGNVILRRVYKEYGKTRLHAENPTISDTVITNKDLKSMKIIGKVRYIKFEVR